MENIIKDIIEEYKQTGHINIYVVGCEGCGKTILCQQILAKLCEHFEIMPKLEMVDLINFLKFFVATYARYPFRFLKKSRGSIKYFTMPFPYWVFIQL